VFFSAAKSSAGVNNNAAQGDFRSPVSPNASDAKICLFYAACLWPSVNSKQQLKCFDSNEMVFFLKLK
jgi:hypothetical protein